MVVEFQLGMAVVGDNRGENDRPVAQSPDGSWSFEDARRRRDQREAEHTTPAPPSPDHPEPDLSALALSLADNLTIDGTPLSQLETHQGPDTSSALDHAARDAPTAEEIMGALEAEQQAAAPKSHNGAGGPRRVLSPRQPSARQRRPHVRRPSPGLLAPPSRRCSRSSSASAQARPRDDSPAAPPPPEQPPRPPGSSRRRRSNSSPPSTPRIATSPRHDHRALARPGHRVTDPRASTPQHTLRPDPARRARPPHRPAAHPRRSVPVNRPVHQAPARPRAPRPPDRVNHPQRPSRKPSPAPTRARAPPPHPKQPSNHWSQEPAPAAASSPNPLHAHRKVGNT